jgi:hypothetical protein
MSDRHFASHGVFDHVVGPAILWGGDWHAPLWSWDDGYFSDLKYRHYDRYGYWPYNRDRLYPSGEVEVVNGQARYHYDRGYPYRRYEYQRGSAYGGREVGLSDPSPMRCRTQWVWNREDRKDVPVRICSH